MSGETMGGENLRSVDPQPVDPHLNTLTRTLFRSLHQASGKFAMFGHQNETSNVIGPNTDSDVHAVTGTYPALWGSDLSGVERDETTNIDGFSMGDVRDELLRAYTMGAVTTMSWHSANPITFGGYGHNMAPGSVAAVLPGGARHGQFLEWLDRVASFLDSVVDGVSGESVPIVFRPFHEHTGRLVLVVHRVTRATHRHHAGTIRRPVAHDRGLPARLVRPTQRALRLLARP